MKINILYIFSLTGLMCDFCWGMNFNEEFWKNKFYKISKIYNLNKDNIDINDMGFANKYPDISRYQPGSFVECEQDKPHDYLIFSELKNQIQGMQKPVLLYDIKNKQIINKNLDDVKVLPQYIKICLAYQNKPESIVPRFISYLITLINDRYIYKYSHCSNCYSAGWCYTGNAEAAKLENSNLSAWSSSNDDAIYNKKNVLVLSKYKNNVALFKYDPPQILVEKLSDCTSDKTVAISSNGEMVVIYDKKFDELLIIELTPPLDKVKEYDPKTIFDHTKNNDVRFMFKNDLFY